MLEMLEGLGRERDVWIGRMGTVQGKSSHAVYSTRTIWVL